LLLFAGGKFFYSSSQASLILSSAHHHFGLFAHSIKLFLTILAHLKSFPWAFSICFNFSS
jgi:hypothetical protein